MKKILLCVCILSLFAQTISANNEIPVSRHIYAARYVKGEFRFTTYRKHNKYNFTTSIRDSANTFLRKEFKNTSENYTDPWLLLTGGTLTGALTGTSASFSGSLNVQAGNYFSVYRPDNGWWWGMNMNSSNVLNFSVNGGPAKMTLDIYGNLVAGTATLNGNVAIQAGNSLSVYRPDNGWWWGMNMNSSNVLNFSVNGGPAKMTLDIYGNLVAQTAAFTGPLTIGSSGVSNAFINSPEGIYFNADNDASGTAPIVFGTARSGFSGGTEWMRIATNGYIGIGTNSPTEKLSVYGNISANGYITTKKITVTELGWSDYVFAKDYKLRSLSSLESYIKTNKHLPEMPSAKEVEANGINVGDNQALLLKKIEELTLYLISQDKKIEKVINENRKLRQMLTGKK